MASKIKDRDIKELKVEEGVRIGGIKQVEEAKEQEGEV